LPRPTSVIAEINLSTFDTASASFGTPVVAYGVFTHCTTDGSNPPLPPQETFAQGTLSGSPIPLLVRNWLSSLTYEIDVMNAAAHFIVNVYFWPSVIRG